MTSDFTLYIITAFALVFILEGLLYTLFPHAVRKMFATALTMKVSSLRKMGLAAVFTGTAILWALKIFSAS